MPQYNSRTILSILLLAISILLVSCNGGIRKKQQNKSTTSQISVFAAASLTDVLSELIDSFEVKNDVKVVTNTASSGTLARQIEQGGTPNVYISANKRWADYVDSLGFVVKPYKETIAHNDLVLITPIESSLKNVHIDKSLNLKKMLGNERLVMGDPSHVPAGRYAKQALDYFDWYSAIETKMLPTKDVRSALMVVELGEAPLGIVYQTDAQKSDKVKIIGIFPTESHQPIAYVSCLCKASDATIRFYNYLKSPDAKLIWNKYGFN